ncbi:hypothetical protein [Mycobacterium intracellulare]|uniref:Uncharacterized protein n=2 Tax=Mycobacterium intracellulare TaxID=1767 RepID=H8IW64_MYCIA|nr:hypothetical protein [Mycobacterium intracellulare]AFC45948.1 hypothetical protein OCU_47290 [Mycobacterium intracellulare ATCC 13950]UQC07003.1 hypothetical protein KN251_23240 [Mycobacterium intracellulare ATCC 13950]
MTDDEWEASPPGEAMTAFKRYIYNLLGVVMAGGIGGLLTGAMSAVLKAMIPARDAALIDANYQKSQMWGLSIIASFGAFEAYVEDFAKGVMKLNSELLDDERILQLKVHVRDLLAPEEEKFDRVYRAMNEAAGRKAGIWRYEEVLKFVGLKDEVPLPDIIEDEFKMAQMVRHVWAHNAGIADTQFVNRSRSLGFGFAKGEVVAISQNQAQGYILAITAYGVVIANRHRQQCGLPPMPIGGGSDNPIMNAFRDFYS